MIPRNLEFDLQKAWRMFLFVTGLALVHSLETVAQESHGSFELEILPLLTKHGCNSGACHGAVAGRGHFFLSLWGSDPKADYEQIVHAFGSRRIRYQVPEESLLIAKPSGRLAHEGGERFDPESPVAKTLARWIQAGAPYGDSKSILQFEVTAKKIEPVQFPTVFQLDANLVTDGPAIGQGIAGQDITDRVTWEIDPNGGLEWIEHNPLKVRLVRPGRHLVLARFADQVRSLVLIAPYPVSSVRKIPGASWIDGHIDELLDQANVSPTPLVDDLTWLRRTSFHLIGRLPTLEEIEFFEQLDPSGRKPMIVDQMVGSPEFGVFWTYKLARWIGFRPIANEPQATVAFHKYLKARVSTKHSWKQIAKELILSTGDSHEVGAANFSRLAADPRAHAELISKVFLGSRLGCANCHNHPLDRWTQDDYHGMAAILSGLKRTRQVSIVGGGQVTNLRTKEPAIPKLPGGAFLNVQLGEQVAQGNLEQLTEWIFDHKDPKFAKVLANWLWASMMGRGIVQPVDDFRVTNPPSHPQLLERLATMLIDSDYQPAVVLKAIALSDTYARGEAQGDGDLTDPSFFAAHDSKVLAPEVLYDAIGDSLGGKLDDQTRAIEWLDPTIASDALDLSGRCGKATACELSNNQSLQSLSLPQQLHWINGSLVNRAIESRLGFLHQELDQDVKNEDILVRMSLRLLTKHPNQEELRRWTEQIPEDAQERKAWFEDWTWSLISSHRFLTN